MEDALNPPGLQSIPAQQHRVPQCVAIPPGTAGRCSHHHLASESPQAWKKMPIPNAKCPSCAGCAASTPYEVGKLLSQKLSACRFCSLSGPQQPKESTLKRLGFGGGVGTKVQSDACPVSRFSCLARK